MRKTRRDKLMQCFNQDTQAVMNVQLDRKTRVDRDKANKGLFAGQEGLKTSLKEATKDRTYLTKALKKYDSIFFLKSFCL